jgi:alpha-beta hydrolase superfamily lysophospholipase
MLYAGWRDVLMKPASPTRGTIAVFGGRGEFIEKYFEVVRDLLSRGFAVAMMDWRGQGGSDRPLRNVWKGHVDDFSHFGRDLEAFAGSILEPYCPRPWFGLGHSMGGSVLLIGAEAGRQPFDRLILSSPMIAVKGVNHLGPTRFLVEALDGARADAACFDEPSFLVMDPTPSGGRLSRGTSSRRIRFGLPASRSWSRRRPAFDLADRRLAGRMQLSGPWNGSANRTSRGA